MSESTAFVAPPQPTFHQMVETLAKDAVLAFIENGRHSLGESARHVLAQGYAFLQRVYPNPRPKDAALVQDLQDDLQVALLDAFVQSGMPGVRQAVRDIYERMHQTANKSTDALPSESPTPTPSVVFDAVRALVAEHLNQDAAKMTMQTSLVDDLDADSLDVVEIMMLVESHLHIDIDPNDVAQMRTIGDLVNTACALAQVPLEGVAPTAH